MTELVQKMTFSMDEFTFENGKKIKDFKMGYETYGKLNAKGDNAVFICTYHSGTSHAAGKYRETDKRPGYWDNIIGPNKLFDTNRYFVVSSDNFANLQVNDPDVITTGPATINPDTGKHYAMSFPAFTTRDVTNAQYFLLKSLKVNKLAAVIGASMGGVNAFEWAVAYPDFVERVISLGAAPVLDAWTLEYESLWMDPIRLDPKWNNGNYYGKEVPADGMALTLKMLTMAAYSADWAREKYGRQFSDPAKHPMNEIDNTFLIEKDIHELGYARSKVADPNHMIYLNKMAQLVDIGRGFPTYEDALKSIKCKILMAAVSSDVLFPLHHMKEHHEKFIANGVNAEFAVMDTPTGHMGVLLEIEKILPVVEKFLNK